MAARELLTAFHRLLLAIAALSVVAWPRWKTDARSAFFAQLALGACVLGVAAYAALSDAHPFYLLAVLAPLAAALPIPGRPAQGAVGGYLLSLLAITALTHVLFFGEDRYHLVVTPLLCILAAAAVRAQGTVSAPSLSASAR
ncbi:MAG: hypothetical protein WDO69_11375 [Pseudomonadota bacterium]